MSKIIIISGPTASGKTALGIEIAQRLNGVIVNADAMQLYKGLLVLSAQPTNEEKSRAEHKLYSVLQPDESNNVYHWLELLQKTLENLEKNVIPIVLGGTGMYLSRLYYGIRDLPTIPTEVRLESNQLYEDMGADAFWQKVNAIDAEAVAKIDKRDKHRLIKIYEIFKTTGETLTNFLKAENKTIYPQDSFFYINLDVDRGELYERCNLRFKYMLERENVLEEVKAFREQYPVVFAKDSVCSVRKTLGLQEIVDYLDGRLNYEEMYNKATQNTRHYAKRQYTWFRNQMPTANFLLHSIPKSNNIDDIADKIVNKFKETL